MVRVLATKKISDARARSFLLELANLREDDAAVTRFLVRFGDFFRGEEFLAEKEIEILAGRAQLKGRRENATPELRARARWYLLQPLQIGLHQAWDASGDMRAVQWKVFQLRQHFFLQTMRDLELEYGREDEVPPPTAFEQAMEYFLKHAALAKRCQSASCPAPQFFATRKSQFFCSDICAAPSKRAAKLRWWNRYRGKEEVLGVRQHGKKR